MRRPVRLLLVLASMVAFGLASIVPGTAAASVRAQASGFTETWSTTLADKLNPIAGSSPMVAILDGAGPAVVVGDRAGNIYAWHTGNGSAVAGWPVGTGGHPVDATPSTADLGGGLDTVFVGEGNPAMPQSGGYNAYNPNGSLRWHVDVANPPTDTAPYTGVAASMAVGNLQGSTDVTAGTLGQAQDAINAASGAVLPGFPYFQADSSFSTPALADLYHNGQTDIIEGNDSTAGIAYNVHYTNGGHLRIIAPTGNSGTGAPAGGTLCDYATDQTVQSSPAVGELYGNSTVGIAFGTGTTYAGATTTNALIAIDAQCQHHWTAALDGATTSSPALADVAGNGHLDVVEGTRNNGGGGSVWVLDGATGNAIWHQNTGAVFGGVVTADLYGTGHQDVVVPTISGAKVFDGLSGALITTLSPALGLQNSPLISQDPNGTVGITLAGYNGNNQGEVDHYELTGSNGGNIGVAGSWPMFHHDPQLTGDAGTPPPVTNVPCNRPAATPAGYWLTGSDGGVFTFGNLPFCGSTGSLILNQPVVGLTASPDAGGYWLVASDGGVFAFGDALFHGSTGGMHLNAPIVGIATTPDGGGYWLVASDGGIFTFGDATFHGSAGNIHLNQPIVGMAATRDGSGYWLVASDGGVFAFGDAAFQGSTGNIRLNRPVVGIAADRATGGYWLAATDGGIFSFNAPFLGSTGNIRLNQPVVGIQAASDGSGYRLVATDGGIFSFNTPFYGSTGAIHLNRPIVGLGAP